MKLALGTAQFGMTYGIANTEGQISQDAAKEIISSCKREGIEVLDTAIAYGESEATLGRVGVESFKIVSKLPPIPESVTDVRRWVIDQAAGSIARLSVQGLYGLMLHRPADLFGRHQEALVSTLAMLKAAGTIQKVGVSVYSPAELSKIFEAYDFDLVQCPFSLLDRRLVSSGWLQKLTASGVEVHSRSSFLQGLLLMPRYRIPPQFKQWDHIWNQWDEWLKANSVSHLEASLAYVLSEPGIRQVVIGIDSIAHLKQIVSAVDFSGPNNFPDISTDDEGLLNPTNWTT